MMSIGKRGWSLAFGSFALLAIGFGFGHFSNGEPLAAQQAKTGVVPAVASAPTANNRVVAHIFGKEITREEFGDYLISHFAKDRLELYVNRRIIEMYCTGQGVSITEAEIDATIKDDCKRIGVSEADYKNRVLKERYQKTEAEWREDVLRPRLLLAKLVRNQIKVDEEDLKKMFENRYGAKARVKIILWPPDQRNVAFRSYDELRREGPANNRDLYWDAVATKQPDGTLAARAGEIDPIGRHSGSESAKVEQIAFDLKVGEVSSLIELPIGFIVIKRIGTVDPVVGAEYAKLKEELRAEVVEQKLAREIPLAFLKIKEEAKPEIHLKTSASPKR